MATVNGEAKITVAGFGSEDPPVEIRATIRNGRLTDPEDRHELDLRQYESRRVRVIVEPR